mgnify:CR=1 FL=1
MTKDYAEIALKYANDVVSGKILAGKYIKLACQRHIDDLQWQEDETFKYYFDERKAERVCKFLELLPLVKGAWAARGEKMILGPWQVFFVANLFGWCRKKDDTRRYRQAMLFVSRKNGKSAIAAGIGLYMFCADGEYGAEVYSGANSEKQAFEVWRPAKQMVDRTDALKNHFKIQSNAKNLSIAANGSRFETVIAKPGDGASPSCAITDELHEADSSHMLDTFITGMGAREQPLLLVTTTAGDNLEGPCYSMVIDAQRMLEGAIENDEFFAMLYCADPEDDWTSDEAIYKSNPNINVSVSDEFLFARRRDALQNARKQSTYQIKHLCRWVGAKDAYYNVEKWKACANTELTLEQFAGQECFLGLDLAQTVDIAAIRILFPRDDGGYTSFGKYYLPEATLEDGANEHYRGWMNEGWLTITDGNMIDFDQIEEDILDICSMFHVREMAFDPFQATMLVGRLMKNGVPCIEVRPTVPNFSQPMKTLDGLIREKKVSHNGDPIMTWMVSNVVAKEDKKENVYPNKPRKEAKIDGVIAELMALARMPVAEDPGDLDDFLNNALSLTM